MTGWAATNTLRERGVCPASDFCDPPNPESFDCAGCLACLAALALVETALDAADELIRLSRVTQDGPIIGERSYRALAAALRAVREGA